MLKKKNRKPIYIDERWHPKQGNKTSFYFNKRHLVREDGLGTELGSTLSFHCDHVLTQEIIDESSKHQDVTILEFKPKSDANTIPFFADSLDLSSFRTCSNLTEVRINNVYGPIDLSPLQNIKTLIVSPRSYERFYFKDTLVEGIEHSLSDDEIVYFHNQIMFPESKSLRSVTIHGGIDYDRTVLAQFPRLKELIVEHPKDMDWTWLSQSKSIRTLKMKYTFPKRIVLPEIQSLKELSLVKTSEDRARGGKSLEEIDLSPLSVSKKLEELTIWKHKVKDIDFTPLSSCEALRELKVMGCDLGTIDLSPLSGLPLEEIDFRNNQTHSIILPELPLLKKLLLGTNMFQTIDLNCISADKTLSYLDLSNNHLIEIDLNPISALTSLHHLDVRFNRFEELDLSPLSGLTKLSLLRLTPNKYLRSLDLTPILQNGFVVFDCRGVKIIASKEKKDHIKSRILKKMTHKIEWY